MWGVFPAYLLCFMCSIEIHKCLYNLPNVTQIAINFHMPGNLQTIIHPSLKYCVLILLFIAFLSHGRNHFSVDMV